MFAKAKLQLEAGTNPELKLRHVWCNKLHSSVHLKCSEIVLSTHRILLACLLMLAHN